MSNEKTQLYAGKPDESGATTTDKTMKQFVIIAKNGKMKSFSASTVKEARKIAFNFLAIGVLPTPGAKLCQRIKW